MAVMGTMMRPFFRMEIHHKPDSDKHSLFLFPTYWSLSALHSVNKHKQTQSDTVKHSHIHTRHRNLPIDKHMVLGPALTSIRKHQTYVWKYFPPLPSLPLLSSLLPCGAYTPSTHLTRNRSLLISQGRLDAVTQQNDK